LDDLLWVLTDDQLKAALHFADSLSGLLKRATEETQKIKGARKLEVRYIDRKFEISCTVFIMQKYFFYNQPSLLQIFVYYRRKSVYSIVQKSADC